MPKSRLKKFRHRQLLQEQAGFNEATDPLSKQIIELQVAALQRAELTELLRQARATPRPEDDVIVARLKQIQQQQDQIGAEIQSTNHLLQQHQKNMAELEELRRRYRENNYDAYNSSFLATLPWGAARQVLQGLMNSTWSGGNSAVTIGAANLQAIGVDLEAVLENLARRRVDSAAADFALAVAFSAAKVLCGNFQHQAWVSATQLTTA